MADTTIDKSNADGHPKRRGRRWLVIGVAALALIVTIGLILPAALAPVVQRKLQAMVSNHLHARLEVGSLSYRFPYGVIVRDAKFVTDESHDGVQLITVKSLDLALAKLPLGGGPIVIRSFTVIDPVVHLVRREDGSLVGAQLAKRAKDAPRPRERMKLSDILQLRQFELRGARVVFEDRTNPDALPMEWRDISAKMDLNPQTASRYHFNFTADSEPVAHLELKGAADIDSLIVDLERLAISADVRNDAKSSPLPAQLQQILKRLSIEGTVRFDANGQLPLKDPKAGQFAMNLVLERVRAQPSGLPWAMDELSAKLRANRGTADRANILNLRLSDVSARGMGAMFELQSATGTIDLAQKTWRVDGVAGQLRSAPLDGDANRKSFLHYVQSGQIEFDGGAVGSYAPNAKRVERAELTAKVHRLCILPTNFHEPLEGITGTVRLTNDRALLQNFTARYGNDRLTLNQAVVSLSDLPARIDVLNILASAEFGSPSAQYPKPLDVAMEQLHPSGKLDIQGVAALYRRDKKLEPDYSLQVFPQGGSVLLLNQRMPVTNLSGEIAVAPRLIELKYVQGESFGGKVALRGNLVPRTPINYDGELRAQDVDLSLVSNALGLLKPDGSPKLSGRAVAKVRFMGEIPKNGEGDPLQSLAARGRVYVKDGNFWSLKVLDGVVSEIKFARDLLTAGEAAAAFEIKDGKIDLQRAAINSSALGIQGTGVIELKGAMDLNLVVAPLGDWRRKIKSTGIPLLSNVAGDIVGGLQKLVNNATSQLLFEFRVTGKVGEPKISAVPAPFLTDNAASLFGMMMRGTRADRLIEAIAGRDPDEPKPDEAKTGE